MGNQEFVIADIPGLIQGAHEGRGLGHQFLGHVERCGVLVHVIDLLQESLLEQYELVRRELAAHSGELKEKDELVALNKCDAMELGLAEEIAKNFRSQVSSPVHLISAVSGYGMERLVEALWTKIESHQEGLVSTQREAWHP